MRKLDLRCKACGHLDADIRCSRESLPTCSVCGGDTKTDWSHGQAPAYKEFAVRVVGQHENGAPKTVESPTEMAMLEARIKERFPGHSVRISSDSAADKKRRADEARQAVWADRKARGISEDNFRAHHEQAAAVTAAVTKKELSANRDPTGAVDRAVTRLASPAELAGECGRDIGAEAL